MSSAGMLLCILFEKIMLIINIDQADLHFRWCAKVLLYSDGGKTALKNHARLNYFYFVYKNRKSGRTGRNRQKMVCLSTADQEINGDGGGATS